MTLDVMIPAEGNFYSLYAYGLFEKKTYDKDTGVTTLSYGEGAVIILYYYYPAHREACVVRNARETNDGSCFDFYIGGGVLKSLPGLSLKTRVLCAVSASRVDKLRRAASWLRKRVSNLYALPDDFFIRLQFLLDAKGKLNYPALTELALKHGGRLKDGA